MKHLNYARKEIEDQECEFLCDQEMKHEVLAFEVRAECCMNEDDDFLKTEIEKEFKCYNKRK